MFPYILFVQEEYEFARVFPITFRTLEDLRKPFETGNDTVQGCLQLTNLDTVEIPDPFYLEWMENGGVEGELNHISNMLVSINIDNKGCNCLTKLRQKLTSFITFYCFLP